MQTSMIHGNTQDDDISDEFGEDTLETDPQIMLGASSATLTDEEMVMSNPHLKKLFNKMLHDRIKQAAKDQNKVKQVIQDF